ncbi:uncharacterized protein KY384_007733 [Bacidia gigantensis]|uniref:uncharacterized protein n=1 Tax=Bacidia gigantensis TaxID=2732470 RepID=UPI001D05A031|nr:uncharacterized protein KY384_007733 [Bacidia gigantensis]KAG8527580.1 hypothetical protein KY384_007733 [Bacidia gigantensis]
MPDGTLAGVYVQLPEADPSFRFLGAIGTEKQSAIFRVKETGPALEDATTGMAGNSDMLGHQAASSTVTVGISIEPATSLNQQLQELKASQASKTPGNPARLFNPPIVPPLSTKVLAQRIIKNAFNFLASLAGSVGPGGVEVVPLKSFQDWWSKFERRIEHDPGFLEREDG